MTDTEGQEKAGLSSVVPSWSPFPHPYLADPIGQLSFPGAHERVGQGRQRMACPLPWQPFQGRAGHSVTNSSTPASPASQVTHSLLSPRGGLAFLRLPLVPLTAQSLRDGGTCINWTACKAWGGRWAKGRELESYSMDRASDAKLRTEKGQGPARPW